jgi:hypothetical protein
VLKYCKSSWCWEVELWQVGKSSCGWGKSSCGWGKSSCGWGSRAVAWEVELWLWEVYKRRHGSLPLTSDYFIKTFLTSSTPSNSSSTCTSRQALKPFSSLHSTNGTVFISPGWKDLPGSLPALEGGKSSHS